MKKLQVLMLALTVVTIITGATLINTEIASAERILYCDELTCPSSCFQEPPFSCAATCRHRNNTTQKIMPMCADTSSTGAKWYCPDNTNPYCTF